MKEKIHYLENLIWDSLKRIAAAVVRNTHSLWGLAKLGLFALLCIGLVSLCVMSGRITKLLQPEAEEAREEECFTAPETTETAEPETPQETETPEEEETKAETEPTANRKQTEPVQIAEFTPSGDSSRILSTNIQIDGAYADYYQAGEGDVIDFDLPENYSALTGITTFRGNNFRNTAQYGLAELTEVSFGDYWTAQTSSLNDINGNRLSGSGWTGQPIVVQWPEQDRANMNMYEWAEEKTGLIEVIYPCLDGCIYFFDLETGNRTRDAVNLGISLSGGGTLDPRGYPILYVGGSAINENGEVPGFYALSLLDGSLLYSYGTYDSFAVHWNAAFTSTPLVDAQSDQLIYPGENGVIYLIKLNSFYDSETGEISLTPGRVIKWRYSSASASDYLYGFRSSPVAWQGHMMIADRGGNFMCLDLNTLTVDWCMDSLDLTNCTPVLEIGEDGHPYIYLATSFHYGFRAYYQQSVPIWKIDAENGEILWQREYLCYTKDGLGGGVIGSLALGSGELDGLLFAAVARYPEEDSGWLVALDTETGEEIWHYESGYAYASPTCFYDTDGNGYVLHVSRETGELYWLDGLTGMLCDQYNFGVTMESSPVVYDNRLVVGTSNYSLFAVELK